MDVKAAVRVAAQYVADLESLTIDGWESRGSHELLSDLHFAIEGAHYSDSDKTWCIEVGFVRPWDKSKPTALSGISVLPSAVNDKRTYKKVTISDETEEVMDYSACSDY